MSKIAAGVFGLIVIAGIRILIMIHGWGLEPQSWGWIVGGGIVSALLAMILQKAIEEGK